MDTESLVYSEHMPGMSGGKLEIRTGEAYQANNTVGGAAPYPPQQGGGPKNEFVNHGGPAPAGESGEHEPEPPPPAADSMEQHAGYGNIGFEGATLPPPSYDDATSGPPPDRQAINSVAAITDQEARDAIIQHVSEHCCYGKGPAAEMQFTEMKTSSAFHYTLETFGEARSTKWVNKPYLGEGIAVSGPPPGPWDIQLQPPQMFASSKVEMEVPNTASVKPCYNCHARGYRRCTLCFGRGMKLCTTCGGSGMENYYENGNQYTRRCTWCIGGYSSCTFCGGTGQVMCSKCQGRGNLRWFILLTVQWTNHLDDHIVERTALPDELIRTVSGLTAFEETSPRVWPVNHFPEQEINAASNNIVSKHAGQFTAERILMQRHRVRIIPVTEVFYNYKKQQNSTFFVYSEEHKVYAPDYPAKCCWGCTVL
ncbi:hypothetical protein BsWGS_11382 [Bradybaena similaris]